MGFGKLAAMVECRSMSRLMYYIEFVLRFADNHATGITALATIVIAIFTLTLWIATSKQARLARDSIALARSEFISTHRPRVIIRNVTTTGVVVDYPISISFMIVNIGDSIANIDYVESVVFFILKDEKVPRHLPMSGSNISTPALASGESHSIGDFHFNKAAIT
jgi:hypothetical protein